MKRFFLTCLISGALICYWGANAATLTVTNAKDSGPGSLRQAIEDAQSGDKIRFTESLIEPIELETTLEINKGVTISGDDSNKIKINGGDDTAGRCLVLKINKSAGKVTLNNLIIAYGLGGVDNSADLTIENSFVRFNRENKDENCYGGICNSGQLTVANCWVCYNTGSGIVNMQGSGMSISDTVIQNNQSNILGGGIYNTSSAGSEAIKITNCEISRNMANAGGGIFNLIGKIIISGTKIHDNVAKRFGKTSFDLDGGGIYNAAVMGVDSTSITNNTAARYGGGVFVMDGALFMGQPPDCNIQNNTPDNKYPTSYSDNKNI